jgi:hypothetical protein
MMTRLADFLTWAAVWPFLTALGVFIDRYYVPKALQDRVQAKLISIFVFIDEAWKRFYGGSRAEVTLGKKGRIAQAMLGLLWVVAIAWWADRRARRVSAAPELEWSYLGPFAVGAVQGLLGGAIASVLFVVVTGLLFGSLMLALHFFTRIVTEILSVATDPKNSPFGFFGSLLGLVVIAAKLTYAFLVPSSAGPAPPH